jgi:hypothetical protein
MSVKRMVMRIRGIESFASLQVDEGSCQDGLGEDGALQGLRSFLSNKKIASASASICA